MQNEKKEAEMKSSGEHGEVLLNKLQLSRALNLSPRSVENYMRKGWVPYVRVGRSVRFDLKDVLATLKQRGQVNAVLGGEVSRG